MSLLIIILVIVFLAIRRWNMKNILEAARKIPCGIKSLPFLGHAYLFIGDGTNRMTALQRIGRDAINNGGMTKLWLGSKYYFVTVDPVDIEVILKTSLEKDDIVRFGKELIGNGTLFAPVPIWKPRRKIVTKILNMKNLNNFVSIFANQSDIMVDKLKSVVGTGVVSLGNYMTSLTLYSTCETALGLNLGSKHYCNEPFLNQFETCRKLIASRMLQPWLHPNVLYKCLPYHTELTKNRKGIQDFINQAIKTKRNILHEKIKRGIKYDAKSFLELVLEENKGCHSFTDLELQEEVLVFVLAGNDTSAVGTSFALCMLAMHQDIQEKVVQELQEVFGDTGKSVTADDLPRLVYLSAVIKETLRLYPPVPVIVRKIERDFQLPSGVQLIKGCGVLVNIWATHRYSVYWGDDAEEFRPERFLDGPLRHSSAYLAFSTGPRNCLGYQYGMMSMKTALATFLRRYRVLCVDENNIKDTKNTSCGESLNEPFKISFDVMIKEENGFKVELENR